MSAAGAAGSLRTPRTVGTGARSHSERSGRTASTLKGLAGVRVSVPGAGVTENAQRVRAGRPPDFGLCNHLARFPLGPCTRLQRAILSVGPLKTAIVPDFGQIAQDRPDRQPVPTHRQRSGRAVQAITGTASARRRPHSLPTSIQYQPPRPASVHVLPSLFASVFCVPLKSPFAASTCSRAAYHAQRSTSAAPAAGSSAKTTGQS